MNNYFCEPCLKFFNGIRPYESHLASENHKKKVNEPTSIVQSLRNCSFDPSNGENEPYILCLENGYKCTLCSTSLNSMDQVRCHISGARHLKEKARANLPTNSNAISHNQRFEQVHSSNWEGEPFIKCLGKDYKCTLCNTCLNSMDQVRCHIRGAKHLKEKARAELPTNSNALSRNSNSDQVDNVSSSSVFTDESRFQFYMHDDDVKELIENMKVFKSNDEIVFNVV